MNSDDLLKFGKGSGKKDKGGHWEVCRSGPPRTEPYIAS